MPENEFQVISLRAFKDNYVWTLRNARSAAVVDPGEAQPVLDYLAAEKLQLVAILATHHHQDHIGGIADILQAHAVPVYGPRGEPITTLTHPVGGGDKVAVPELGLAFEVLDIPGHTRAHIAYYGSNMLFCGDTLFACGCGRVFEGTPQQLHASLQKLAALPEDTLVYCGHEYTLANIGFAKAVEPDNSALLEREMSDGQANPLTEKLSRLLAATAMCVLAAACSQIPRDSDPKSPSNEESFPAVAPAVSAPVVQPASTVGVARAPAAVAAPA